MEDSDNISSISSLDGNRSEETLSIWEFSDNDLQSLSSSSSNSSDSSISSPTTDSNLSYNSNIDSPLSSLSNVNNLESFSDTCSSTSEEPDNLQSPSNNATNSKERTCTLSVEHDNSLVKSDVHRDDSTSDYSKSMKEVEDYHLNKLLYPVQELSLRRKRFILKKSSENKSDKDARKFNNDSKCGTRQEHHVTNTINSSLPKRYTESDFDKNGTSTDQEEQGLLEELASPTTADDFVVGDTKWVKSDSNYVSLDKSKVSFPKCSVSQDDGNIQTLEDLFTAKSLDLKHKGPNIILVDNVPLKSIPEVDFSKYASDMSKVVHSLIGMGLDGTYHQHLVDQTVMNATIHFDHLEYAPDFLLIDGDDVGFQPDVNEEATGDLFVSNGQNVSDYNEQLSIADPASDGYHHGDPVNSSSQTYFESTPEFLFHEETNGLPLVDAITWQYDEPNIDVEDEIIDDDENVAEVNEEVPCFGEQLKLATDSAVNASAEHHGFQEEESMQNLEPLTSWVQTIVVDLDIVCQEETGFNHPTRLSISQQSLSRGLSQNDMLVCTTSTLLSSSDFLVDGNCVVEALQTPDTLNTSLNKHQICARLCGQFVVMVYAKDHAFSQQELRAELALAYSTAKLLNLIAGIALPLIDDVLNNAHDAVRFSSFSSILPGLTAQIMHQMLVDNVSSANPVDIIRAHQRESFYGIPLQVSNEETESPLLTAPDWNSHSVPRTQLMWQNYPSYILVVNGNENSEENNCCGSPHSVFNSSSANPNVGGEQFTVDQRTVGRQYHRVPTSLHLALVNCLAECQCEEQTAIDIQTAIDMGALGRPPLLLPAEGDPDPGDPGWTETCDYVDSTPSHEAMCVILTQQPTETITSDFEVTCVAVQETGYEELSFTPSYSCEWEERFSLTT